MGAIGARAQTIVRICWLLTLVAAPASAQPGGRLAGVVRDDTGAVLPGVEVSVGGLSKVSSRTVVANEQGHYELDGLPAGRYRVTAALSGFETRTTEVRVDARPVTLDLVLAVSALSERVMVTGTKTGATDVQSTPVAITAVPGRTIEQLGVERVGALAGLVPGVTVTPSPGGYPLVTIRGIGTNSAVAGADPSSTAYLDGVYLGRPAMASLDFLNVQRVEVLRGPQGTLYGRNSVGGAIHIVTAQPTNTFEGSVRLTGGNYNRLRAEGSASGPLIKNKVMANVAFLRGTREGFVHDLDHPDHPLGGEDTWAGRGQLRVVFGTQSELLLSGDYARFGGVPLSYAKPIAAKPGFTFDNPAGLWTVHTSHLTSDRNIQRGASAKLLVRLNATTTLTSLTAYRRSSDRLFIDVDATELSVATASIPDFQHQVSQELTVVQRTPAFTWIGGAYFFDDHNAGQVEVSTYPAGIQTRILPAIDDTARALFGQATYSASSRVSLTGGVRYTDEEKDLDGPGGVYRLGTSTLADASSFYDFADQAAFHAWTPKGGIQVQLSPDAFVYASATRGFKSGGFNTTARVPGKAFGPEFAWSYEGGVKGSMADGRVRANTAVFYNSYRALQVLSFVALGAVDISNAGSATIKGVEAEMTAAPGHGVQLAGNVSWVQAVYDRYLARVSGGSTLDARGHRLNNSPAWSGAASATYEFSTGRVGTASLRGDVSGQSRVFFTPANDAVETQRPYRLVHLRAGFEPRSRRWGIGVYVRNAGNREYIVGTANVPPTAFTARPGEPRQWGTQFTVRR